MGDARDAPAGSAGSWARVIDFAGDGVLSADGGGDDGQRLADGCVTAMVADRL
jgi:hypothetical protein